MPEPMQADPKSEGLFGALSYSEVDSVGTHRPAQVGRPDAAMRFSSRNTGPQPIQVLIDVCAELICNRVVKGPAAFCILSGNIECPKITVLQDVTPYAHGDEGAV